MSVQTIRQRTRCGRTRQHGGRLGLGSLLTHIAWVQIVEDMIIRDVQFVGCELASTSAGCASSTNARASSTRTCAPARAPLPRLPKGATPWSALRNHAPVPTTLTATSTIMASIRRLSLAARQAAQLLPSRALHNGNAMSLWILPHLPIEPGHDNQWRSSMTSISMAVYRWPWRLMIKQSRRKGTDIAIRVPRALLEATGETSVQNKSIKPSLARKPSPPSCAPSLRAMAERRLARGPRSGATEGHERSPN